MKTSDYKWYLILGFLRVTWSDPTLAGNVNKPCVCSDHPSIPIYPNPIAKGAPTGYMYKGECLPENNAPQNQHANFATVEYLLSPGYVKDDAFVTHKYCTFYMAGNSSTFVSVIPGSHFSTKPNPTTTPSFTKPLTTSNSDFTISRLTTTTNVTKAHTSGTSPSQTSSITTIPIASTYSTVSASSFKTQPTTVQTARPPRCNKMALFSEIARSVNVGTSQTNVCPDGIHHQSDAAISALCGAPLPTSWLRGLRVIDNCSKISQYTPIAQFDYMFAYKQLAGVFLACEKNSIFMATQDCSSGIHIVSVDQSTVPDINKFYVIEW